MKSNEISLGVGGDGERLHALDAVRGGALLLGVFFHAALAFLPGPQIWLVADASRSTELSVLFFVLHIFRMSLFFLLAGFFARMLLERRGVGGFILDRAKRIALPLVSFWPIVFGLIVAVLIWTAVRANGGADSPPPPPMTAQTFPLTHLWFLYVLLIFYAIALALRGLVSLIDRDGAMRTRFVDPIVKWITGPYAPLLLAAPVCAALYFQPNWMMWFGVPTPEWGLIPNTAALVAYGLAFGFGWLVNRQIDILQGWAERWLPNLMIGVGPTITCLMIAGLEPLLTPVEQGAEKLIYAALYAFAMWCWTLGLIGFALRYLSGHSPIRRYLADASYWIYIVHLPLVLALQAAFAPLAWPWFVKYPLIVAVAFVVMLASYQLLVRHSFIGAMLNGRTPSKGDKPGGEASTAPAPA